MRWLLWWLIDTGDLRRQIAHYKTLGIVGSARGQSFLLLTLSAAITTGMIELVSHDRSGYIDVGVFLGLGLLILLGQRWAIILAMAFWTLEKVIQLVQGVSSFQVTPSGAPIVAVIWWSIYMHAFYMALRVENGRRRTAKTAAIEAEASV